MHAHCPYRPQLNVVPASTAFSNVQRLCSHCLSDESDRLSFPIQILYLGCPHSPNRKPKNPIGFYLDEEVKKKLVYETGYCALHETMISPISTWCTFDETKSNKGGGLAINNQQKTDITAIRRRGPHPETQIIQFQIRMILVVFNAASVVQITVFAMAGGRGRRAPWKTS